MFSELFPVYHLFILSLLFVLFIFYHHLVHGAHIQGSERQHKQRHDARDRLVRERFDQVMAHACVGVGVVNNA